MNSTPVTRTDAALKRLLVIDDSVDIGELVQAVATPLGFTCSQAATFSDIKDQLDSDTAVIVLDLVMPGVDGIEVLRYLAQQRCRAEILLLSGADWRIVALAEQLALASGLRVLEWLTKPASAEAIKACLLRAASAVAADPLRARESPEITQTELRRAVAENQFVIHYQPQIDIESGAAAGLEVLVRWQHPQHGLLFPDTFIGLAEAWGLIDDLTWCVVAGAFAEAKTFSASDWFPRLAINVAALSLRNVRLPDTLYAHAKAAGMAPERIVVEITESGKVHGEAAMLDTLARLRLHGINLSIDDFGTGYSMMHQLKRVPANEVKIDKAFLQAADRDRDAKILARKITEIGHELGMTVVAEGVETDAHLQWVSEIKCDIAQGYLFSRPMPVADTVVWRNTRAPSGLTAGASSPAAGAAARSLTAT